MEALDQRARTAVPTARNFRAAAVQAVDGMKKATGMFDASTIGFAQEMIADTHNHRAQTVGELLAFMRKYRLLFAPADKRPEDAEQYLRLYRLLRQQKDLFGDKAGAPRSASQSRANWVPLFNGRDLSGWEAFQNGRPVRLGTNLVADRGELVCPASTHGRLQTAAVYPGFVLRLEYLFPEGGTVSDLGFGRRPDPGEPDRRVPDRRDLDRRTSGIPAQTRSVRRAGYCLAADDLASVGRRLSGRRASGTRSRSATRDRS